MDKFKFSDLIWKGYVLGGNSSDDVSEETKEILKDFNFEGARQAFYTCKNSLLVSVLSGQSFWSNGKDTYEVWVLDDERFSEPQGYKTEKEVEEYIQKAEVL